MLWEELLKQMPAFTALVALVYLAGRHIRHITTAYMRAMESYMVQVRELSVTCHTSHENVANKMAEAVKEVRLTIEGARETQQHMAESLREVSTLLKRNGM